MTIWLNGGLCAANDARIDPADRGLLLGDGLFETMRLSGGAPARLSAHLARLRHGASVLGIPVPYDDVQLLAGIQALAAAARVAEGSVRLTLTRGAGPRGLLPPPAPTPTVMMTLGGAPPETPARLMIAQSTRRNEHSPLARLKSLNYLDNVLARMEAERAGADDAVLLNTAGLAAETTVANIFWVKEGRLFTPPITQGALPGVRRSAIIAALSATERALSVEELADADEIFLSNSLSVRSVVAVGDIAIRGGPAAVDARRATSV